MSFELLNRALDELEVVLDECKVKLIVGGGFGLFLLQHQLHEASIRTIIEQEYWCVPRSTADIDILLETSIVANLEQFQLIRQGLDRLSYSVIDGARYMHFEKHFSETDRVEINFLTVPIQDLELEQKIQVRGPRARPRGDVQLHAYLANDAIALSDTIYPLLHHNNLYIPSSTTFLIMKLHAFKDRFQKDEQEKSAHHAMDVYRVISMMTEVQYEETQLFLQTNCADKTVRSTASIVKKYFNASEALGILKIREHPLYRPEFKLETFRAVLSELFFDIPN